MLIIPAVRVRDEQNLKIIPSLTFNSTEGGSFMIRQHKFNEKNVVLAYKMKDTNDFHIIACYDTTEEAEREVEKIIAALKNGDSVYQIAQGNGRNE